MTAQIVKTAASPAAIATGRDQSFFLGDLTVHENTLREAVAGKRILAVGAAGSIGSNTVFTLCRYGPRAVHVIDQNENSLAEFVRQFRSSHHAGNVRDLRALPLDYGSKAMRLFLEMEAPYDLVLNFAAIKHVRSEKDIFSILQMLDTNIVKQARFMGWVAQSAPDARYFSVSTDKAANPSSFMGATKRVMEHVLFDDAFSSRFRSPVTSARFANVAFSNGSLLQAFENRLARREPLACPDGIRRYFVSLEESGHICTLASLLLPSQHIGIPRLDPQTNLVPLRDIAEAFLRHNGFEASIYEEEASAKVNISKEIAAGRWPLILTKPDTAGEKPYEEFIAEGENAIEADLTSLQAVSYRSARTGEVARVVDVLSRIVLSDEDTADKDGIKSLIGALEPRFLHTHRDSALILDQRM
ncbi:predicted nucleoside-diphosphate sugar epimerase [Fulvimarina pelagi HTCC2506]|uniref:Predicted nucleoside-diphosphate sugar epimerase n=1 Tax=Fulvimarina pelagi HTCC2506 TaxID=314231 RepID=Q0FYM2_9HYPH|nr:UDP-N-acetylglucosamine 4,6-dehydratase [Fulvimarina pelagi]EAU39973.1 predicted nucleoside-diphosphate sugar epimerase [Fulvimarina pelagi HTCC2506]